ncbi:hypothetical protein AAV35_005840 [Salimicrobium jeotgali]|uniref:Putative aromatic acid exporter C-terminal domain-containing protein n=1 Tax=Salimicrobium jeotgali TaxID=1230341 RepID=K2FIT7_9BACI|nr:aromatic acid exporter family protein [Salimicrobium jeotgali]AKG04354.1 hypothetical protein AAV35_005840 [Salimicrobium jeotgali]EKE31021.1 hypothetical protein MJ3_10516 [Salimicrobium jeotgali]
MRIGSRTIKTALGTPLAIWMAQLLELDNFASAGIVTILCIQVTRKRSLLSAWHRFAACMLAILYSFIFFEGLMGFTPLAIGVMLLLFIPTTVRLKITPGIITSSVIVLHLYTFGKIDLSIVWNEFLLIVIGIGIALILNIYMPSLERSLEEYQTDVEDCFSSILKEISLYLKEEKYAWAGEELTRTAELLEEAKALAYKQVENRLLKPHHPYYHYFHMRTKQFELLEQMLPLVTRISQYDEYASKIGDLFEDLSGAVHPGNTALLYLRKLEELRNYFKEEPLPESREEFESRASLYQLLNELEDYLIIKRSFKRSDI